MNRISANRRFVLHTGMALSMSLLTIGGCANPTTAPALGGDAQSEAFPGTTGNMYPAGEAAPQEARAYVANATALTIAKVTASTNAGLIGRITDGDLSSCWDSGSTSNPWVAFELGQSAALTDLDIKVNPVGTYDIEVSADGQTWTAALTKQANTSWNVETKKLPAGTTGKFVRLKFANGGKKVMLFEAGLKGGAAETAPAPAPSESTGTTSATASHTNGSYVASRAIDGNADTEWQSGAVSNPSLTIALPASGELQELAIKTKPGAGTYDVEVSEDGASYKAALTGQSNSGWGVETKKLPAGTQGRYMRLKFANGGKNVMVFEATVKQAAGATPAPGPSTGPTPAPSTAPVAGTSATHTNGSYVASRAFDGNNDTEWQSGAVSNPALTVDRGASSAITGLGIKTNTGAGTYSVEVSDDGVNFKTILTNQSNSTWNVEQKSVPAGTAGRFIRLKFANGGKNVMVFEVVPGGGSTGGGSTPAPTPTPGGSTGGGDTGGGASSGTTIYVETGTVLHRAESRLLGTNRNHAANDFPNGAAKLAKLKELTPQWGDRKYLYRIGHGPTDGRNDYDYMTGFHFEQSWGKTSYPYDDVREGLKDAAAIGADQMHVVNYGTSDPAEAGRYVSYLNKAGDANRAKYPHAQQNVKWFEIGNEIPWSMVRGHDKWAPNETTYAQRAKLFAQEMRKNSDVPIKIGAVASINSNWMGNGWSGGATTVKNILQNMGSDVDFLIYHGYPSWPLEIKGNLQTIMAQNEWNRQKITNEIKPAIKQYGGGRDIRIANTEFFTHLYNDVTRSRGLFGALYSADTMTLAFNENLMTAVQFCFEHKDMADASFFINSDVNNTTAIFKFQKMLAEHWGDNIVKTRGQEIPSVKVSGSSTTVDLPKLAFTAATSGSKTYVMVTNRWNDADVKSNVNVGFNPSKVTAYELTDANGWNAGNATVKTVSNPSLNGYTFKQASVTILEIER